MGDALIWWLTIELLGLLAVPLAAALLPHLPDRGYAAAKPLGLLLVGWLAYLLAMLHLLPFERLTLVGCGLALGALSGWLLLRDGRALLGEFRTRLRRPAFLRYLISAEVLFTLAFAVWALVRAGNPNIVEQEKFMDFGFLNTILKSGMFPPHDMWLAGQPINYYYFGYVLIAVLTSLSGVIPAVAFNLGAAGLFALTALGAFGLVYNLITGTVQRPIAGLDTPEGARPAVIVRRPFLSPILYAVLAALMLAAMGNLTVAFATHTTEDTQSIEGNGWRYCFLCAQARSYDWWAPSRVVQDYQTNAGGAKSKVGFTTINEFPAFSFILADMHPHVLMLPFVLLTLTLALGFARRKARPGGSWRAGLPSTVSGWLALIAAGVAAGALYAGNTWDYPTYLGILVLAGGIPLLTAQRRAAQPAGWGWLRPWLVQGLLLVALSVLTFLPFHLTFVSLVGGDSATVPANLAAIPVLGGLLQKVGGLLLVNTADKTILGFLVIFGIFLLPILVWLGSNLVGYLRDLLRADPAAQRAPAIWIGFIVVAVVLAVLLRFPLFGLLVPMAGIALALIWRQPERTDRNFALLLTAVAALIGLVIEVVFLKDNFQMRMNTLFKFYFQIWTLWAVVAAYGLWQVLDRAFTPHASQVTTATGRTRIIVADGPPRSIQGAAGALAVVALLLVASGLLYPFYGAQSRQGLGNGPLKGLDGTAWVGGEQPADLEAIGWLNAHAQAGDRVLEAGGDEYGRPGRVSAYTGIPTLVAWDNSHEALWRTGQPALRQEINARRAAVNAIYQGVDPAGGQPLTATRLLDVLHQYGVTYVFAGAVERSKAGWAPQAANQAMTAYAEGLFQQALPAVFHATAGDTVIYAVKETSAGTGVAPAPPVTGATPGAAPTAVGPAFDPQATPVGLFAHAAGPNRGQLSLPRSVARDAAGNFYVADTGNLRIQKFDPAGGFLALWGSKGTNLGQFAPLSDTAVGTGPSGIAVDSGGNVYVADTWNHRIEKFDPAGKPLTTWGSFLNLADAAAPADPDPNRKFYGPRGLAFGPDGLLYVTDTGNKRVLIFDRNGVYQRQINSGMSPSKVAPAVAFDQPGELNEPIGIAVGADGSVYVADTNNRRIQKFDASGKAVAQWPLPAGAWEPGPYLEPFLALDSAGNLYASAPTGKAVLKYDPTGKLLGTGKTAAGAALRLPTGLTVGKDGAVYVVDTDANAVVKLDALP